MDSRFAIWIGVILSEQNHPMEWNDLLLFFQHCHIVLHNPFILSNIIKLSIMLKMEIPVADEIIKRIQSHKGVQGVIVTTKDGTPVRSTMDNTSTVLFVGRLKTLYTIASSMVRDIDPVDKLLFLRIRTSKHEMMLSSNAGEDYMAIVIQNPNEA